MKEKYNITIANVQLNIVTEEPEEYIKSLAVKVDERVNMILKSSRKCSKIEAILFCTLDFLDEKNKTDYAMENLRKQINGYMKDLEEMKRENDELKKIIG